MVGLPEVIKISNQTLVEFIFRLEKRLELF